MDFDGQNQSCRLSLFQVFVLRYSNHPLVVASSMVASIRSRLHLAEIRFNLTVMCSAALTWLFFMIQIKFPDTDCILMPGENEESNLHSLQKRMLNQSAGPTLLHPLLCIYLKCQHNTLKPCVEEIIKMSRYPFNLTAAFSFGPSACLSATDAGSDLHTDSTHLLPLVFAYLCLPCF